MPQVLLRKIEPTDKKYFAKWWRDKDLLKLTSGFLRRISDTEVDEYFQDLIKNNENYHFVIMVTGKIIGHISLAKRKNNWYETQIIIGEKENRGHGYGSKAIKNLLSKAKRLGISKIYLEVRPTNTKAIEVYEYCGFKKTKKIKYPKNKFLPETLRMEIE